MKNPPEVIQQLLLQHLKIDNPKYSEAVSAGRSVYGINPHILHFSVLPDDSLLVPRGIYSWLLKTAQNMGIKVQVTDGRKLFDFKEITSSRIRYRSYQFDAVVKLVSSGSEGILVAPAGSGKTVMGLSIIPLVGQPTLWLTHTGPLAEQAIDRANSFLPEIGKIGMIGGGKWEKGDLLTIGMVQTLIKNPDKLIQMRDDFGLVIQDECHHVAARTFLEVICHLNSYYMYGLTATPYRRDKLENLMFQAIGVNTTIVTMGTVSDGGGILPPSVLCRIMRSDKVDGNDIQKILTDNIVHNTKRNRVIAEDVLNEAKDGRYCIVVSDRRDHCEILYKLLQDRWPGTGIATGKYSKKYVKQCVEDFNDNKITILITTFALLGEGFDVPFLDRAFITMPFRAEAKTEQLIGRIQRTHPGKEDAVVYDYVDIDVGVLKSQFHSRSRECRYGTYKRLGVSVDIPADYAYII